MSEDQEILFERRAALGVITLNRPKALNALTLEMLREMGPRLKDWAGDPEIKAVVIRGSGDKAFCAGGDIRRVAEDLGRGGSLPREFFRDEYRVNRMIHRFPKPYVALADGVTMGGGVGVSVHGSHRVATERTLIAMPETAIGFFPDVGGTFVLSRLPGELGTFLALTGYRLRAADGLYSGLATHYVESGRLSALETRLAEADWSGAAPEEVVDEAIRGLADDPGRPPIAQEREAIDRCFAGDGMDLIVAALEAEGTEWASSQLDILGKRAPLSLKVTLEAIRRAARMDFDDCMRMEYRLSQRFMAGSDFAEGVRAVLIDKDQAPRWQPSSLDEVTDEMLAGYFAPLDGQELTFEDE